MKKILILLFLVFFQFGYSQTRNLNKEIDSLLLKGRYQLALKKLKSLEPTYTSYAKIANIYYQVDKTKLAIVYYKKSLDLDSVYSTKVQLGKAYQKVKKYDEAISIYKDIVEKDSLNLLLKYQLGKIYLIKRKATLAVETFQELYDLDATNANYSYQKGIGYAMKKQRNKMIGSFLEAYKTDSTHMKSINQLATSFAKLGDKDSTFLFINKGLSLEPNHFSLNKTKINQLYKVIKISFN
jgi:tetratricopeptide (TPR) repeat protein